MVGIFEISLAKKEINIFDVLLNLFVTFGNVFGELNF